jgi:hypothetical protein
MQNSAPAKLLAALAILIAVLVIALHFLNRSPQNSSAPTSLAPTNHFNPPQFVFHPRKEIAPKEQPELDAAGEPKISREQIENCLQNHNRSAASLLAAFHALGDTNYLNEAAQNFPNDPHVIWTVLARDEFPQDRRKWLDVFKTASPENSLANYLSAQDYLQNGQTDAAINELETATSKPLFDDFSLQSRLDEEELTECGGKSALASGKISLPDTASDILPELATFRRLAQSLLELQKQKLAADDTNSVENFSQIELALANRLLDGESGKLLVNQLVGLAIENVAMSQLDQNAGYDFLNGETPAQVLQENKQQKITFQQLNQNFRAVYPSLTDDEMASYLQRSKIYGEAAAMQWVVQQHPPNSSQSGQQ